jgi:hypothetical protein
MTSSARRILSEYVDPGGCSRCSRGRRPTFFRRHQAQPDSEQGAGHERLKDFGSIMTLLGWVCPATTAWIRLIANFSPCCGQNSETINQAIHFGVIFQTDPLPPLG